MNSRVVLLLLILPMLIILHFAFGRVVERKLYLALFTFGVTHVLVGGRLTAFGLWFTQKLGLGVPVYFGGFVGSLLLS